MVKGLEELQSPIRRGIRAGLPLITFVNREIAGFSQQDERHILVEAIRGVSIRFDTETEIPRHSL